MVMVETLTDEQIQSCLSEGINLEIFKRHAIVWQKLMPAFYDGKDKYVISDVQTAINYCMEIKDTFTSEEHTPERDTEFYANYNPVLQAGIKLNELLMAD
jgi:hypothetical protein